MNAFGIHRVVIRHAQRELRFSLDIRRAMYINSFNKFNKRNGRGAQAYLNSEILNAVSANSLFSRLRGILHGERTNRTCVTS
jgi:hypothetical protein